jgi:hypothetical protein
MILTTLAWAADDRPFGSITIVRSLMNVPGTIFAPGSRFATCSTLLALAVHTSTWPLFSASMDLPPVRRTSSADFNVLLRNWSDEEFSPTPILTPARSTRAASANSRQGAATKYFLIQNYFTLRPLRLRGAMSESCLTIESAQSRESLLSLASLVALRNIRPQQEHGRRLARDEKLSKKQFWKSLPIRDLRSVGIITRSISPLPVYCLTTFLSGPA